MNDDIPEDEGQILGPQVGGDIDDPISEFDTNSIKIMVRLMEQDLVDDNILDHLSDLKRDYFNLVEKNKVLEENVNIDLKTKLLKYNDKYFTNIVKTGSRFWDYASREKQMVISFARLDIDDFSIINNAYGHAVGDEVLVAIAQTIKSSTRPTDYCIRFGGEEIDLIMPATPVDGALTLLSKLFTKIRELEIETDSGEKVKPTLSCGLSYVIINLKDIAHLAEDEGSHFQEIFEKIQNEADCALYDAKLAGKDRYEVYAPDKDYESIRKKYAGLE